jgi:hypothetical protein
MSKRRRTLEPTSRVGRELRATVIEGRLLEMSLMTYRRQVAETIVEAQDLMEEAARVRQKKAGAVAWAQRSEIAAKAWKAVATALVDEDELDAMFHSAVAQVVGEMREAGHPIPDSVIPKRRTAPHTNVKGEEFTAADMEAAGQNWTDTEVEHEHTDDGEGSVQAGEPAGDSTQAPVPAL